MSTASKYWSVKDDRQETPDETLRGETFFNTGDGRLYRVTDFILIKEPYGSRHVATVGMPPYAEVVEGVTRWYIILEDIDGEKRVGFRYRDFRDDLSNIFHRVKNAKPKVTIRDGGGRGNNVAMGQGHNDVKGVHWEAGPDGQRRPISSGV